MMFAVPLYFQITARASSSVTGAHLVPAVVGNAVGGILAGLYIKWWVQSWCLASLVSKNLTVYSTGRYKALALIATMASSCAYLMLILRWHGYTNWLESLYIAPGGFGSGMAQSALFISIQAAVDSAHRAVAASTLSLCSTTGMMTGMAAVAAVLQEMVQRTLGRRLLLIGYNEGARRDVRIVAFLCWPLPHTGCKSNNLP